MRTFVFMRILVSILLVVLLNSFVGYYPLFLWMQQQVKQEMQQRIKNSPDRETFTVFLVSKEEYANIDWVEENEFRFHGEMYDVAKREEDRKGNILLYVIHDNREKQLFIELEEQTGKSDPNSTAEDTEKTIKLFSEPKANLIYFLPGTPMVPPSGFQFSLPSFVREIQPPPPKIA